MKAKQKIYITSYITYILNNFFILPYNTLKHGTPALLIIGMAHDVLLVLYT